VGKAGDILEVRPELAYLFSRLLVNRHCGLNMVDSSGWPADGYAWRGDESLDEARARMENFIDRVEAEE
jgi:hypothetical protein